MIAEEFIGYYILKNNYFQYKSGIIFKARLVKGFDNFRWIDFIIYHSVSECGLTFDITNGFSDNFKDFQKHIYPISKEELVIKDIIE